MVTIVNTVGTSIITNFLQKNHNKLEEIYEEYEKANYSIEEALSDKYKLFKNAIKKWAILEEPENLCAETKSLYKIKNEYEDNVIAYFLATDTILSVMAAEIIVEYLTEKNPNDQFIFKEDKHIIAKTNVHNNYEFKKGIQNLIYTLEKCEHYINIINFSGGYKSLIPYLTLYATIKDIKLSYIYEDSDSLIEIPRLPLYVDYSAFDKLEQIFYSIDAESEIPYPKELSGFEEKIKHVFEICTEKEKDMYSFSEIGYLLWEIYKETKTNFTLAKVDMPPKSKRIKISGTHHGNDKLWFFASKIIHSPYVVEVLDSLEYKPWCDKFIYYADKDGTLDVVLYKDDRGLGLRVKTTGRSVRETMKIGEILEEKYYS